MRRAPLLLIAALGVAPAQVAELERPRPDVLLIFVDDANDWVGYLGGHPGARTPHLDRLAARGVAFTNAHCPVPLCAPSRRQMLSGVRTRSTRSREERSPEPWLTEHFAAGGYRLVGAGKVFPEDSGSWFPEYFEVTDPPAPAQGRDLLRAGHMGNFDWRALDLAPEAMPDHRLVTWVAERLQREDETPVLFAVGLHMPHLPWYLPSEYFERHPLEDVALPEVLDKDLADVPVAGRALAVDEVTAVIERHGLEREIVQAYLAALSFADDQIGRLLDALAASPRADRTIVVLTSDHGWHLGEKRHWRKQTLWEDATRVPLIVVPPGSDRGRTCSRPVDTMSLYPTLCELAGLPVPEHVRAPSLAPLLADPAAHWEHAALTVHKQSFGLRTERYRYIRYRDGGEELYDHASDPHEWTNLAGEDAETLAALRATLDATLARYGVK